MNAPAPSLDLAPALVVLPGPRGGVADATGGQAIRAPDARDLLQRGPVLVAHASMTARRLGLTWGVHAVHTRDIGSFEEMVAKSKRMALRHHIAAPGDRLVVMAGVPFGVPGSTNVLHVATLTGDELRGYS